MDELFPANPGLDNLETIQCINAGDQTEYDLQAGGVTKLEMMCNGESFNSTDNPTDISFSTDTITFRPGAFDAPEALHSMWIFAYIGEKKTTLFGPGRAPITLQVERP